MKYFVVNAFTEFQFGGNPAGVCLPDHPLDDTTMQRIAAQNNLAETAFLLETDDGYSLRWFTPEVEIDLCGHATLATAFVLMSVIGTASNRIEFKTKSGILSVERDREIFTMDFPSRKPVPCEVPAGLESALGVKVLETHLSRDLLVEVKDEDTVRNLNPDLFLLSKIDSFGIIVTAKGSGSDFVSRYFAPNAGIAEDPVTGSSHCTLIPYWSERSGKDMMTAKQLSKRGGELHCENCGDRVKIGGKAKLYLIGEIQL